MANPRLQAKDLPCLFENHVEKYQHTQINAKPKKNNNGDMHQERSQLKIKAFS